MKLYNEPAGEPTTDLECEFWVEGNNITHQEGMLRWLQQISGPGTEAHDLAPWNGTPDGNGNFTFFIGPLEAPDHSSLVGAERAVGRVYGNIEGDSEHQTETEVVTYKPCEEEDQDEPAEQEPFECPPVELDARAMNDGRILVNASGLDQDAELMRSAGGETEQVASFSPDNEAFVDTDTEVGTTYTYELVIEGETCAMVEVTAIPVFPTILAGGAAIGVSMLGYAAMRRRR